MRGKNSDVGDKYKDVDWIEQIRKFRGEGTIRAIRIEAKAGFYRLWFEEGGKQYCSDDKSRKVIDEMLLEFGGKNEETVEAPRECLSLDGSWDSEFLLVRGHTPISITIRGSHVPAKVKETIRLGAECGYTRIKDAHGTERNSEIAFIKQAGYNQNVGELTINFTNHEEFDSLTEQLLGHKQLKHLSWKVHRLITYAKDDGKECVFIRKGAGDRSSRMVLKLVEVGGVKYVDMILFDIYSAADGMIGGVCRHIPPPAEPKPPKPKDTCVDNEMELQWKRK